MCLLACLCASCRSGTGEDNSGRKASTGSLVKWRESEALRNADRYAPDSSAATVENADTTAMTSNEII